MNTNCLEHIRCPRCGHAESFYVAGEATFLVFDTGVDETSECTWNEDSSIWCPSCGNRGRVGDFRLPAKVAA